FPPLRSSYLSLTRAHTRSTLLPYTTLFRSERPPGQGLSAPLNRRTAGARAELSASSAEQLLLAAQPAVAVTRQAQPQWMPLGLFVIAVGEDIDQLLQVLVVDFDGDFLVRQVHQHQYRRIGIVANGEYRWHPDIHRAGLAFSDFAQADAAADHVAGLGQQRIIAQGLGVDVQRAVAER